MVSRKASGSLDRFSFCLRGVGLAFRVNIRIRRVINRLYTTNKCTFSRAAIAIETMGMRQTFLTSFVSL
jgi:hypothetical protein